SIKPGYTVRPSPSITHASAGTWAFSPTSVINPLWITTVPLLITGPDTGTIFALRIATVTGPSAAANAQHTSRAVTSFFIGVMMRIIYASSKIGFQLGTGKWRYRLAFGYVSRHRILKFGPEKNDSLPRRRREYR